MSKKTIRIPFTTESVNEDEKTIEFVMSTNDMDRHGDQVQQNWKLDSFQQNPVFINSHNYNDAAEAIGKVVEITQTQTSLEGRVEFAVEENPKAKVIYDLYKGGFLNAVSVGFRELQDKADQTLNELLELSAVTVPANAMATAKAKGIDTSPLEEEVDEETQEEIQDLMDEDKEPESEDEEEVEEDPKEEDKSDEEADKEEIEEDDEEVEADNDEVDEKAEVKEDEDDEVEEDDSTKTTATGDIEFEYKEGRVLSKKNKKDLNKIKEIAERILSRGNTEKQEEPEPEPKEEPKTEEEPKEDKEKQIKEALKDLHKEVADTNKVNFQKRKGKIHKAIREIKRDLEE